MNTTYTATLIRTAKPIVFVVAHSGCISIWLKPANCPLASMLDVFRSVVRFIFVAAAGAVLALAGIIISVVAHLRALWGFQTRKKVTYGLVVHNSPPTTLTPRDRAVRAASRPKPPARRSSTKPSVPASEPLAPIASEPLTPIASTSQLLSSPPSPSSPSTAKRPCAKVKRAVSSRHLRLAGSPIKAQDFPPIWAAADVEQRDSPERPVIHEAQSVPAMRVSPPDVVETSSNASTEPTEPSISSDEQTAAHSRGVLRKIQARHAQLRREHCLLRSQSLPLASKPSKPVRRTDPYQAPYFFPTPMSPEAGTYLKEVVNERHGVKPAGESGGYERVRFASPPSSPRGREAMGVALPVLTEEPTDTEAAPRSPGGGRRQRWSWHLPGRPHPPDRARSVDSTDFPGQRRRSGEKVGEILERKESFSKFKFGHHRRHGSGSVDAGVRKAS